MTPAARIGLFMLVGLIILFSGLYTVTEMQYAVITQFGRPVRTVKVAGLKWKKPIIQKITRIEKRVLVRRGRRDRWAEWRHQA